MKTQFSVEKKEVKKLVFGSWKQNEKKERKKEE
jgi:hypothetical protein